MFFVRAVFWTIFYDSSAGQFFALMEKLNILESNLYSQILSKQKHSDI